MGKHTSSRPKTQARRKAVYLAEFERLSALTCQRKAAVFKANVVRKFLAAKKVKRLDCITEAMVQGFLANLLTRRKPHTVRNHANALCLFCDFLVGQGVLPANPAKRVRLPKVEKLPPLFLDQQEYDKALKIASHNGIWPEVALALSTGLRLAELQRLEWGHVDFAIRKLLVRKSKSGRSRIVWLNKRAIEALNYQWVRTSRRRFVFPGRERKGATGMRGHVWWTDALKPLQEAIPKFQQLPKGSTGRAWHLLRHTFASRAVQAGVSIYKVATWLGHSDVSTTMQYAHLATDFDSDIERVG